MDYHPTSNDSSPSPSNFSPASPDYSPASPELLEDSPASPELLEDSPASPEDSPASPDVSPPPSPDVLPPPSPDSIADDVDAEAIADDADDEADDNISVSSAASVDIRMEELHAFDINFYLDANWVEPIQIEGGENIENGNEVVGAAAAEDEGNGNEEMENGLESGYDDDDVFSSDSEMVRGMHKQIYLPELRKNIYCANVAFSTVTTIFGHARNLCSGCFQHHQVHLHNGLYTHYNFHYRAKLNYNRHKKYCYICKIPLYQLLVSDICLICQNFERWKQ